jgi:hypothetical protein
MRESATEQRNSNSIEAAVEIEALLDRGGFDAIDINAEGVQARELFDMFDQLMIAAQRRRIRLLWELSIRHEFVRRIRQVRAPTVCHHPTRRAKILLRQLASSCLRPCRLAPSTVVDLTVVVCELYHPACGRRGHENISSSRRSAESFR